MSESERLVLGTYESDGVFPTEDDVYDGANMIVHDPCLGVPFTPEMARAAANMLKPGAGDVGERRRLRAVYDAAEYRLIASIADRKAIMCASDYRELTDAELASLDIATSAVDGCRAMVEDARRACEAADVVVNTHAAMPYL